MIYIYDATLVRIIDGDTVVLNVDLGFRLWREDSFRLYGINSPEMRGESREAGIAAREHLKELLSGQDVLQIHTHKDPDKYGRYLVEIFLVSGGISTDINAKMIEDGFAVRYMV